MGKTNTFWRTDYQIRASQLRVIGSDGKLIGVLGKDEAVRKAKDEGLTLVEIAPNAVPPVAKIVDFGKFRYQEEKKLRKQAKGAKGGEVKEIRFSPFIADKDFETRLARVKEFLGEKNKAKIVVVFLGKQMGSKPFGYKLIERIMRDLGDTVVVDMPPKFLGRHLITIISPTNKKPIKETDKHAKTENSKIDNK